MRILALDPSTKCTGWCVMEDGKIINSGIIKASSMDVLTRIEKMVDEITKIYNEYNPEDLIMEDILPEDIKNIKTSKALFYLQAALMLRFHQIQKPIELVTASHWRKVCGIGTGRGVLRNELKLKDIEFVLTKYNITVEDDQADAICIAHCYFNDIPEEDSNWVVGN